MRFSLKFAEFVRFSEESPLNPPPPPYTPPPTPIPQYPHPPYTPIGPGSRAPGAARGEGGGGDGEGWRGWGARPLGPGPYWGIGRLGILGYRGGGWGIGRGGGRLRGDSSEKKWNSEIWKSYFSVDVEFPRFPDDADRSVSSS